MTSPTLGCHRGSSLAALALSLNFGCQAHQTNPGIQDLEVSIAPAVNTVVELAWSSDEPGVSWVEYSVDGGPLQETPPSLEPTTEHSAVLVGLPSFAGIEIEVFTQGAEGLMSEQSWIETLGLPASLPDFEVDHHQPGASSPEPYLLAAVVGLEQYLLIIDRAGEVLWYRDLSADWPDLMPMNVVFADGGRDLMFGAAPLSHDISSSYAVTLDLLGQPLGTLDIEEGHHDMVQLPDGGLAVLQHDLRSWFDPEQGVDVEVYGDAIVEFGPDGASESVFSTWDWRAPEVHERFYKEGSPEGDWTHANGLHFDPESDSYMMSLGHLDTVLQVDRASGEVVRELGAGGYSVTQGTPFEFQHDADWTEEGTVLMSSTIAGSSRVMAIEYTLDESDHSLAELWSYGKDEGFESCVGGQAFRLANGNTLLNTGYRGLLVEVNPSGEPVWELSSSMGGVFVSVSFFEDLYTR